MADYDLKIALKRIGEKRLNFGLYRGKDADQILVSEQPASSKLIAQMEKECGPATRVFKGLVFYDGALLIFATKMQVAPQWSKQIREVLKARKYSSYNDFELRQLAPGESDEVTVEEPGPPDASATTAPGEAAPEPQLSAVWMQLKQALTPQIQAVSHGTAANKTQILDFVRAALGHEKAGQFAEAIKLFQEMRPLLASAGATAPPAPPAPPPPKPAAAPVGGDQAPIDALLATMAKLTPVVKATLASHPEMKEALLRPIVEFQAHVKAHEVDAAKASLVQLAGLLKQAGAGASAPAAAPAPEPAATAEAEWQKLFAALEPAYRAATKIDGQTNPEAAALIGRIKLIWEQSTDLFGSGRFAEALANLQKLEDRALFNQALAAKAQGGEIGAARVEKLKFLVTRWQQIPAQFAAELAKLRAEINKTDPDEDAEALTSEIGEYLQDILDEMQEEIDAAINAGDFSVLAGLRTRVTSESMIQHLFENPLINGAGFQTAILDALDEVEAKLAA